MASEVWLGVDKVRKLIIHGSTGDSTVLIGESLRSLGEYTPSEKVVIITDTNVRRHYQKDFPSCEVIEIGKGEQVKNLDTARKICQGNPVVHLPPAREKPVIKTPILYLRMHW